MSANVSVELMALKMVAVKNADEQETDGSNWPLAKAALKQASEPYLDRIQ